VLQIKSLEDRERALPVPFLKRYDSIGVRGWGSANDRTEADRKITNEPWSSMHGKKESEKRTKEKTSFR
jgi:hypothetical protein